MVVAANRIGSNRCPLRAMPVMRTDGEAACLVRPRSAARRAAGTAIGLLMLGRMTQPPTSVAHCVPDRVVSPPGDGA